MAKKEKSLKVDKSKKKPDTFNQTGQKLKEELETLEKQFNEDPDRFVPVMIKGNATSIDLSGPWFLVEKRLVSSGKSRKPETLEKYKEKHEKYHAMHEEVVRLRKRLEKEVLGRSYFSQPVLKEHGQWILEQAGKFRSIREIYRDLTKVQGYSIGLTTIRSFVSENKAIIDKYREDFRSELLSSSIATDAGRVSVCVEAHDYYWDRWLKDRKQADLNVCIKLMDTIRTELKGDITIKIDGKIDINHSIEANKTLGQKFGELNINLIVMALAAQKSGINPLYLVTQLTNGYYNKWNGVESKPLGLKDKDSLIPVSGLIKSYNWDEIREKNKDPLDMGDIEDAVVIQNKGVEKSAEEKKAALLNFLNEKNETKL